MNSEACGAEGAEEGHPQLVGAHHTPDIVLTSHLLLKTLLSGVGLLFSFYG